MRLIQPLRAFSHYTLARIVNLERGEIGRSQPLATEPIQGVSGGCKRMVGRSG